MVVHDNKGSDLIYRCAKTWIGTPFMHQGRMKGIGADCIGLIIGIARELNIVSCTDTPLIALDTLNYPTHPNGRELKNILDQYLSKSDIAEGRLALLQFDSTPQHLGIITEHPYYEFGIIHADISKRQVVEHGLTDYYKSKIVQCYKLNVGSNSYSTSIL